LIAKHRGKLTTIEDRQFLQSLAVMAILANPNDFRAIGQMALGCEVLQDAGLGRARV
jgi:hypothetical protein